jgi:selenocysteine lyase/cysteine desulfurase
MNKRAFLKNLGLLSLTALPLWDALAEANKNTAHLSAEAVASDEDFWAAIRGGYKLKPDYINLENGYYCFLPQEILEHHINHIREVNYQGSYYMRTVQWDNKRKMAAKLAELAGCSPEELIITRNTTESLDMIIGGIHWKAGDEAVMAEQDYGSMLNHFKLMEKKHGIVNKIVSVPNHPKSDEEIVKLYENAITPKTKLLMVCHMINITGHVLPVRKICDMAHAKGVEVMVDGAHAFAHLNFSIADLGCDYYGASLHKWLSVPLGAGILYVKKGKAANVWPLLASGNPDQHDIYSLNQTGTHPVYTDLTIANSIDFYLKIGRDRKEERLRYLQRYWTTQSTRAKTYCGEYPRRS